MDSSTYSRRSPAVAAAQDNVEVATLGAGFMLTSWSTTQSALSLSCATSLAVRSPSSSSVGSFGW